MLHDHFNRYSRQLLVKSSRAALRWMLVAGGISSVLAQPNAELPPTLQIGYQKYGTLPIVKARGNLERRLREGGVKVEWIQFPAGLPMLEALNVGSVQLAETGEAPPIFAQSASPRLVYVATEPPNPSSEAILVPKGSDARSAADLKGRKVAFTKGSNAHYLLVRALQEAGPLLRRYRARDLEAGGGASRVRKRLRGRLGGLGAL